MGTATAPGGHTLTLDSSALLRDGLPWAFISGEFHFSRCPEAEWRDELLKMKAGGVSVVTTYIFWIHHEEIQGTWDWTGQRNLRQFLQACQALIRSMGGSKAKVRYGSKTRTIQLRPGHQVWVRMVNGGMQLTSGQ